MSRERGRERGGTGGYKCRGREGRRGKVQVDINVEGEREVEGRWKETTWRTGRGEVKFDTT